MRRCATLHGSKCIPYTFQVIGLTNDSEHFKNGSAVWKVTKKKRRRRRNSLSLCAHSERPLAARYARSAFLASSIPSTVCHISRMHGCSAASFPTLQEVRHESYGMLCLSTSDEQSSGKISSLKPSQTIQRTTSVTIVVIT